ncbi:MAG: sugar ABC transporter substrate-binding protein [Candidatus Gastranaerophilales bacterium]
MRKIIYIILIILISISLFVFKHENIEQKTIVTFWTLQMSDFSNYINNIIDEFENENLNIKINWVDVPFSEGEKRTLATILSNNPPDLINLNPDFTILLAQRHALAEIDADLMRDFNQEIINSLKYNDKLYSIPWYATSAITIYNKKLLNENNLELPKTYDELAKISEEIEGDVYSHQPNITENDTMLRVLNKNGINSAENINSQKSIEIFENYKHLYDNNLIPKDSITQTHREALEKFMAEKIIFFQAGANFLNMIKENSPQTYKNTDITAQIVGDIGQNDFSLMNFVIPKHARNQKEALEFALFLTNEENQLELAKLTNVIATNDKTLINEFYIQYDENDLIAKARVISAGQLKHLNPTFISNKNQKEINLLVNTAVQQILLNKNSTKNILDELAKKWRLINEN